MALFDFIKKNPGVRTPAIPGALGISLKTAERRLKKLKEKNKSIFCLSPSTSLIGVMEGVYLVFVPNDIDLPNIKEGVEIIRDISIRTFIVYYDEKKDF